MINNEIDFDNELLLKEYELNMSDHDRKEKMVWLASTLYFTFCIAVIGFILGNENIKNELYYLSCFLKWLIICLLIIIFIFTFMFILFQIDRKCKSNENIVHLQKVFLKYVKNQNIKEVLNIKIYKMNILNNKKNNTFISCADISILILIIVFFILKIFLILNIFYGCFCNIFFQINFILNFFF